MNLFSIENGIVIPFPETTIISPFKEIWERDTTRKKDIATKEYAYIEFSCSYKKSNPYIGYPEDVRGKKIIEGLFKDNPDWLPDELVTQGIAAYKDFQNQASPSIRFYEAALTGVEKLQEYYLNLDMKKVNKQGTPVNKPSDVARGLSLTGAVLQNLENLRERVEQELFESNKVRGNRTVNPFER